MKAFKYGRMQRRFRNKLRELATFRRRLKVLCYHCGDTTSGATMFTGRGKGRKAAAVCDDCYNELLAKVSLFEASRASIPGLSHGRRGGHVDWTESGSSFDNVTRAAEEE